MDNVVIDDVNENIALQTNIKEGQIKCNKFIGELVDIHAQFKAILLDTRCDEGQVIHNYEIKEMYQGKLQKCKIDLILSSYTCAHLGHSQR